MAQKLCNSKCIIRCAVRSGKTYDPVTCDDKASNRVCAGHLDTALQQHDLLAGFRTRGKVKSVKSNVLDNKAVAVAKLRSWPSAFTSCRFHV